MNEQKVSKFGIERNYIFPKVTKMGSIFGHRIDYMYNEVGVIRSQWHIPSKN